MTSDHQIPDEFLNYLPKEIPEVNLQEIPKEHKILIELEKII